MRETEMNLSRQMALNMINCGRQEGDQTTQSYRQASPDYRAVIPTYRPHKLQHAAKIPTETQSDVYNNNNNDNEQIR